MPTLIECAEAIEADIQSRIEAKADEMRQDSAYVFDVLVSISDQHGALDEIRDMLYADNIDDKDRAVSNVVIRCDKVILEAAGEEVRYVDMPKECPASCGDCEFSKRMIDPYGTGDSPTQYECKWPQSVVTGDCPWGK